MERKKCDYKIRPENLKRKNNDTIGAVQFWSSD